MIFLQLVVLIFLIYIIYLLSYSMMKGAPYAGLGVNRIQTMLGLLKPLKGKKFIDLGAGDGRIVIEASKWGLDAYGVEINPVLFAVSIIRRQLSGQKNAKLILGDIWKTDLSKFDYIGVWGAQPMMPPLEKKILAEAKPGTKVVSNHFRFPTWNYDKEKNDVYLYIKK